MFLKIYKGFDKDFFKQLKDTPLVESSIESKFNVLSYDRHTKKELEIALINLNDTDVKWLTYQEYTLIKSRIDESIKEDELKIEIFVNNLYPEYYPLGFTLSDALALEIEKAISGDKSGDVSEDATKFLNIYNTIVSANGQYYGSFYNFEREKNDGTINNFYPSGHINASLETADCHIFLNDDIDTYLRNFHEIINHHPRCIGIQSTNGAISKKILDSLLAYCDHYKIDVIEDHESMDSTQEAEEELKSIAINEIGIKNFKSFRELPFYKNPDIDKNVINISQGKIIREIINQAEISYQSDEQQSFRDIFITAPTGAGKSLMFQIPAVYLAKKYSKLTIIIEPVKALMQDQKEKLIKSGYLRVEAFNSDLISQVEKEAVLKRIKDGEVDLLYLSPETLLSYSLETIIGDRDLGLMIVDEAHIVTTWGVGFRPDYWYLGNYINRLRNQIQSGHYSDRKIYHFPLCAFTATAVNGGFDDTVSETIISLYMENPIKFIGYTKRENIKFDISIKENKKLPKAEYESAKANDLNSRLSNWIKNKNKTIVYFPYATLARDAKSGIRGFSEITVSDDIGTYTGRNIYESSKEVFNDQKRQAFENFRTGVTPVIFATKAFGMGIDVDDVENVYHYAVTGNLCDYVQEIGRAARRKDIIGHAITDYYANDMMFINVLFGISQIKQYQIRKVLEGVYDTYKNKNESRNFMISPESFTYIFKGDDASCINQLKTSLLMLEKDFYDKYNFKVLISRPQSVFTKAYVVISRDHESKVLKSKYKNCLQFIAKGRDQELQKDGSVISDVGDVYSIDLKQIWETFNQDISFPYFKYCYFNKQAAMKNKIEIMPEIRDYIMPRQKVSVIVNDNYLLCDLRDKILDDFEYIGNSLYSTYRKKYFKLDDFKNLISERFGATKARIIANSLFDIVDPNHTCVKFRINEATGFNVYSLANGNFKEYLRKSITKSKIVSNITSIRSDTYSTYMSLTNDELSASALKLLSIFGYITYDIVGGEEPEIFLRLNDPNKIKGIVLGNIYYTNNYVSKAAQKHKRDVEIIRDFFMKLSTDEQRWNYIEDYFLGYDVLKENTNNIQLVSMNKAVDREHSYTTSSVGNWSDLLCFFDDADHEFIKKLSDLGLPVPEYLETIIKKSDIGNDIMMSWPSKDTLICQQDAEKNVTDQYMAMGWHAYKVSEIDYDQIVKDLK